MRMNTVGRRVCGVGVLALALGLLVVGPTDRRLSEAFRVSLTVIEQHRSPVVVAVPRAMDEQTRAAIRAMRRGVAREEVPETVENLVPAGYFLLKEAEVRGDRARIGGVLGPIPQPKPLLSNGCGIEYYIDLRAKGMSWEIVHVQLRAC
jgi:hypothetical protein